MKKLFEDWTPEDFEAAKARLAELSKRKGALDPEENEELRELLFEIDDYENLRPTAASPRPR